MSWRSLVLGANPYTLTSRSNCEVKEQEIKIGSRQPAQWFHKRYFGIDWCENLVIRLKRQVCNERTILSNLAQISVTETSHTQRLLAYTLHCKLDRTIIVVILMQGRLLCLQANRLWRKCRRLCMVKAVCHNCKPRTPLPTIRVVGAVVPSPSHYFLPLSLFVPVPNRLAIWTWTHVKQISSNISTWSNAKNT